MIKMIQSVSKDAIIRNSFCALSFRRNVRMITAIEDHLNIFGQYVMRALAVASGVVKLSTNVSCLTIFSDIRPMIAQKNLNKAIKRGRN